MIFTLPITTQYCILMHKSYIAVENMRKGETACNKQFLLFSQCKNCFLPYMVLIFHFKCSLTLFQTSPGFYMSAVEVFENTMGKGEIVHNKQFLLFLQCFLSFWRAFCHFHQTWNCRLQALWVWNCLNFVVWERVKMFQLDQSKILLSGNGLTLHQNDNFFIQLNWKHLQNIKQIQHMWW